MSDQNAQTDHKCSSRTTHVSKAEFLKWQSHAKPGTILVYCTGDIANARKACSELHTLAAATHRAAAAGTLHLTQKRLAPGQFEYRAAIARKTGVTS